LSDENWNLYSGNATYNETDSEIFGYGGVLNWPHKFINLPDGLDLAFHYNETENFVPAADRIDQFRQPIASPAGLSKDWGFTVFAFDNKVVSRFNWYDAKLANASANLSSVFNATISWMFTHWGALNRGLQEVDADGDGQVDQSWLDEIPPEFEGETDAQKIEREIPNFSKGAPARAAIAPYLTDPLKEAYNFRLAPDGSSQTQWAGTVSDTQDIQSKGFEWELVMNPTNNWRVSLNFADTETIITNLAPRLTSLYEDTWLPHLQVYGDLDWNDPIGPVVGNTTAEQVSSRLLEYLEQKGQEGRPQNEQRQYRVNMVTNYRFSDGFLQGFSVGGAVRWQSNNAIGYPILPSPDGIIIPDLDNPWLNEDVYNFDMTLSYRTRIGKNINYTAQINLRNINNLNSDKYSPVRTQPTGQVARIRYDPPFQILLTNTFRF
jgi:hypothetical protein